MSNVKKVSPTPWLPPSPGTSAEGGGPSRSVEEDFEGGGGKGKGDGKGKGKGKGKGEGGKVLEVKQTVHYEAGLPLPGKVQNIPANAPVPPAGIPAFPVAKMEGLDWRGEDSKEDIDELKRQMKESAMAKALGTMQAEKHKGSGKGGIQAPLLNAEKKATAPVRIQFKGKVFVTDKALEHAFQAFDLDGNGFISAAEIRELASYIGEDLTDDELDEMINIMEHNGDGQVSMDEFLVEIKNIASDAGYLLWGQQSVEEGGHISTNIISDGNLPTRERKKVEVKKVKKPMQGNKKKVSTDKERTIGQFATRQEFDEKKLDKVVKKLKKMDKNFSGTVDYKTFCKLLETNEGPHAHALFSNFDEDGNGTIDVRELMIGLASQTLNAKDDKIKFAFMMYDLDGSGDLSHSELEAMLRANHFSKASSVKNKMNAILAQCDKDGDGSISYEEFVVFARKFPNLVFPAYAVADNMNKKFGKAMA